MLGDWQRATQLLAVMTDAKDDSFAPNGFSFGQAIVGCARGAEFSRAVELLGEMWRAGFQPDCYNFSIVISACGRAKLPDRAAEVLTLVDAAPLE